MKKIFFTIIAIVAASYVTGLTLEVLAEGENSKLLRLANNGVLDSDWIPFLLTGDLYKVYNLFGITSIDEVNIPTFVQFADMLGEEIPPIAHANVALDVGILPIIIDNKNSLQNVVDKCIFHSPDDISPLCVICKLLDGAGNVVGKGLVSDVTMSYTGSTQLEIPITPVPVPQFPNTPQANDIQTVMGLQLTICDFNEGCTPGFWRTHSEFGPASFNAWPTTDFTTGQKYLEVFFDGIPNPAGFEIKVDNNMESNPTLFQAANAQGGNVNALARHSTAALLSASSDIVDYAFSVAEVIALVQAVDFSSNNSIENAKDIFELQNEMDCPIGSNSLGVLQNEFAEDEPEPEEEGDGGNGGKGGGKKDK